MAMYVVASGETRLVSDVLPKWIYDETVILSDDYDNCFAEMDDVQSGLKLHEFLEKLRPIPFYRYMVRYLLTRYPDFCDTSPEVASLPDDERLEALAKMVYAEIQAGRKSKPLQNRLLRAVLETFAANGCVINEGAVHGSLTNSGLHWSTARLRELLFSDTIEERQFFVLALGLGMTTADTSAFLQKALLRQSLRDLIPEEGFLRICLETEIGNRYALFQALWSAYSRAEKAQSPGEKKHRHKLTDPEEVQRALDVLYQQCKTQPEAPMLTNGAMQDYWDKATRFDFTKLPENQAFLKAMKKISAGCAENIDKEEFHKYSSLPFGNITVEYRPGSQFTIPSGTVFCDKDGRPVAESLQEVSTVASGVMREIELKVFSRDPIVENVASIEKHSVFRCRLAKDAPPEYAVHRDLCGQIVLQNKSRIKGCGVEGADRRYYLRGTLTGRVPEGAAFPDGTEFYLEGGTPDSCQVFINRGTVSFYNLEVPVQALPGENEEWPVAISRNAIVSAQLPAETLACICGIHHSRLTAQIRTDKNASLLMEYFFGPMPAGDFDDYQEDEQGHVSDYPCLLEPVLRGKRLSDTRISKIRKTGYPPVKRHDLLTALFLQEAVTLYKKTARDWMCEHKSEKLEDGQAQGLDLQIKVDASLSAAGFCKMYLPNPYDALLAYLSLHLDPAEAYRRLWGVLRCAKKQEDTI